MTSVAMWLTALAAGLGLAQQPGYSNNPAPAPGCASPCAQKCPATCACLPPCCEKDDSGKDGIPLSYTLEVMSDTLELLCDLLNPCQTWTAAMTLPSPHYLGDPPQYFPPAPVFPLPNELAKQERLYQAVPCTPVPSVPCPPVCQAVSAPSTTPVMAKAPMMPPQGILPNPFYQPPAGYPVPPMAMYPTYPQPSDWGDRESPGYQVAPQYIQVALPVPCAVPPMPAAVKATFKVVPKGEHHVLTIHQGDGVLVCKKTTMEVGGQDLVFTPGKERVHVHGKSFEASATKISTKDNGTLLLEGDVHLNCDDHGKAMVFKGARAVVEVNEDGHVGVTTEGTH